MTKYRKWVLKSHFSGLPKREDLEVIEEELSPLKDGGNVFVIFVHNSHNWTVELDANIFERCAIVMQSLECLEEAIEVHIRFPSVGITPFIS